MKDILQIVGFGAIVPACVAFGVVFVVRRCLPTDLYHRYAAATSLAAAFFVGYLLLPSWAALVPSRHWQWLPYLAIGAVLITPPGFAAGIWFGERKFLQLVLAVVTAYLLVPNWPTLQPTRPVMMGILGCYLLALTSLIEPLATRFPASRLLALFAIVVLCSSLMITYDVSLKFGLLAGITGAGLVGCWAASKTLTPDLEILAAIPIVVTLVCGVVFIGAIESSPPTFDFLILPAVPLLLWLFTFNGMHRRTGYLPAILQTVAVLAPIVVIALRMLVIELRTDV